MALFLVRETHEQMPLGVIEKTTRRGVLREVPEKRATLKMVPYGLEFYVGVPGCGKSFLALKRAVSLGKPVIALDCRSMLPPECAPEVFSLDAAVRRVFDLGESVRFKPRTVGELDGAFGAARAIGKRFPITIIVDETFVFLSSTYCPPVMEDCCRTQRKHELHIFLTTQQPQDIPARVRNCASAAFVFKCGDENSIKAVRSWAPNPDQVRALSKDAHEFVAWSVDQVPSLSPS